MEGYRRLTWISTIIAAHRGANKAMMNCAGMIPTIAFVGPGPTTICTLNALVWHASPPFSLTIFEAQSRSVKNCSFLPFLVALSRRGACRRTFACREPACPLLVPRKFSLAPLTL